MRSEAGRVVYAPTDLVTFLGSPFASWMDRLYLERPEAATPDEQDEASEMLARRGEEHERAILGRLSTGGRRVVTIDRSPRAFEATREALASGADVIYQAAFTDGTFAGYSDFCVRGAGGTFELWDAKLSRSGRPKHVLQLCVYADMQRQATGSPVDTLVLALGDGQELRLRSADFHWYYLNVRRAFLDLMARFDPAASPPDPVPSADHGRWQSAAATWFEERDHLVRVAGMRRSQIARLADAGITTLTGLSKAQTASVRGIGPDVFPRLVRQARLQIASVGKDRPAYEVLRPGPDMPASGLALLPPSSPNDVFFDMEGFPLADEGLEYLFGAVTVKADAQARYHDWWAHDEQEERRSFEAFVDFAIARWREDRSMHIYHYGDYELAALRRLMGRFGTREDEVDALLRGEVFVNLLSIVRQGLALGEPAYSLKNVERLYRPARAGAVRDAAVSMVEYDRWLESGEPRTWEASPILRGIKEYNEDDCMSTWQLVTWLRQRQQEAGLSYLHPGHREPEPEAPLSPENQARRDLLLAMLAEAAAMGDGDAESRERMRIHELLGNLVEFHRREAKPLWWSLFDKAERSHEELVEDNECLGDLRRAGNPYGIKKSTGVAYTFDVDQETKIEKGKKVRLAHSIDVNAEVEEFDSDVGRLVLKFGNTAWAALGGVAPDRASIVPFDYVNPGAIQEAVAEVATALRSGTGIPPALEGFLRRRPPQVSGHTGGPLLRPDEPILDGAIRVITGLERSCLVIQGPPGSGKTHVAANAIVALLRAGKNIGITSNSHKAIEHLLGECDKAAGGGLAFLKVGGDEDGRLAASCPKARFCEGNKARAEFGGGLVGGTAWLLSRPEWIGALDVLFVDEAGQVSLANLVGMSRAARNYVLLGDQMQLAQPTQGTHPGESGHSLLEYYLQGRPTIPGDLGIFLARTWRLHPSLCAFISDAVYEGRLQPEPSTAARTVSLPPDGGRRIRSPAGLVFASVAHEGNDQASNEEVAAIREIVDELSGRAFTCPKDPRNIAIEDILFVAPYNAQVRRLRPVLGAGARVASVDKFQGQQAPVVVLSMCASPGEFGSRGSAFLLDIHRLNVALSRAQSLAVVVGDPRLAHGPAGSIEEMRRLNLLCRIVATGTSE